ncbi:TadE/TadG family type IV pilus assembly protein [Pseudotabrizicola alkalilacus]|uniref:Pilus assembly protein n=1 Tax=Pseudotabrizicola alkalilacus TaxID=2305252 RepID=A0A411Z0M8_9RHOB|nr:TadE/TadG family type IV pilus assembly protein [Pseudotabrizicola alkalilacus]RGP36588.1 pilus assembly protein [Pseudotabrizicola alkalilacus]
MITRIRTLFRPFRKDERGLASVEFALFFPLYLGMFFWAAEVGILMIKSVMLDHSLDVAMRDLRLGLKENPTQDSLKRDICARARIIGNCEDQMMIELQAVSTQTWAMPQTPVTCVNNDEEIQPVVTFSLGQQQQLMLVRACIVVPVLFPRMILGRQLFPDSTGGVGISSISSFVNEPS